MGEEKMYHYADSLTGWSLSTSESLLSTIYLPITINAVSIIMLTRKYNLSSVWRNILNIYSQMNVWEESQMKALGQL